VKKLLLLAMLVLLPVSSQAQPSKLPSKGWYIIDIGDAKIQFGPFKNDASCKSDPRYKRISHMCIYLDGKPWEPIVPLKRVFKGPGWYRVAVKDSSVVDGPYEIEAYCDTFPLQSNYTDSNYTCKFLEKAP
jgi:hypothetical protein